MAWVLLTLLVAGCGGESDDGATRADRATTVPATAAMTAVATPTPATATTGTPSSEAPTLDLAQALLPATAVPDGWQEASLGIAPAEARPCGERLALLAQAQQTEKITFEGGTTGPFLTHVVARYAGGDAARAMAATRALLERCREWTQDYDGRELTFRVAALSLPAAGDEMVAVRLTVEGIAGGAGVIGGLFGDLLTARSQVVLVRRGDAAFLLAHSDAGVGSPDVDQALTERFVQRADERLQAARSR